MIQRFTLVFWAPAREETEEEAAERILKACHLLREFGPELAPTYELPRGREKVRLFDYTPERVRELIRANVNREGDQVFESLGSRITFLSHRDNALTAKISLKVRTTEPGFSNPFVVDLPRRAPVLQQGFPFTAERLIGLFCELVRVWEPYWGGIVNGRTRRRFSEHYDSLVHWVNFFAGERAGRYPLESIGALPGVRMEPLLDGVLLVLQPEPLDDDNPEHLSRQEAATRLLLGRDPARETE